MSVVGKGPRTPGFSLPVGTVTFLMTDVEGSALGWEAAPDAMAAAIPRHYELLDHAITGRGGLRPLEQGEGDSVVAVFSRASDAVGAALDAQRDLRDEPWPDGARLRVRMALHTGEAELRDEGNYFGQSVNRAARLRSIAHGGQVLLSGTTADLVAERLPPDATLVDRGLHRLKDLGRPEQVWELRHRDLDIDARPLRSLDTFAHNLPVQLTSFVGRQGELTELRGLLTTSRLLTLNGVGGCGKTRLALQLAGDVVEDFRGGAWLVELAAVADPARVAATVVRALGEREVGGDLIEVIVARLADVATLMVLDNCEHLLTEAASLVDVLLRRCAGLVVLATSREPLGVPGETSWRVPSLPSPGNEPSAPEALSAYDAVRLFLDRARKARPNFALDADNAAHVAQICHRLDGIPLAIELAAARVRSMSVQDLAAGLDDRFRLLTGGARTVLPRQQTLQASVDWGYQLLSDSEQAAFRRLSVFAGGFTLDAAEAVVAGEDLDPVAVLDLVTALADKSLVVLDADAGRYRMLESLRQYGAARLLEASETQSIRDRFLAWAVRSVPPWEAYASTPDNALLVAELDNFLAAFEWAASSSQPDAATALGGWLAWRGAGWQSIGEGIAAGTRALALPGAERRLRLGVLYGLLSTYFEAGDVPAMTATGEAMLAELECGDVVDDAVITACLGRLAFVECTIAPARAAQRALAALAVAERAGLVDRANVTVALLQRANAVLARWDEFDPVAPGLLDVSLDAIFRANALSALGRAAYIRGDFVAARRYFDQPEWLGSSALRVAAVAQACLAQVDLAEGVDSGAVAACSASVDHARLYGHLSAVLHAGWAPGAWLVARGDVDEGVEQLLAWRDEVERLGGEYRQRQSAWYVAVALLSAGRLGEARAELDGLRRPPGEEPPPPEAARLAWLDGCARRTEGDLSGAEDLFHEALSTQARLGLLPDLVHTLEALAGVAAGSDSYTECARLAGNAKALRDQMGYVLRWPFEHEPLDLALAASRESLCQEPFATALAEGAALDTAEAVAYARRGRGRRSRPTIGWRSLTPTELQVVQLAAAHLSNADIAARLFISQNTVKTHLAHVYSKLGISSRAELVAQVARQGLDA